MMLWTKEEILKVLEQERDTIRQYGARRLGLFGSYARGEATEQSDLDFIVEFERKSFDAYMDLREFLEKRFNCPVGNQLDIQYNPIQSNHIKKPA